ncbi:NADH-quinone oxidoreductase subunit NuoG [Rhodobacter sp. Har01]|uniref:2Fe-2S iron-sulfur cluster-binding protein n=1 Tax=Rhodobacter sp. Har01 TaxID=2883999 RepID=UPI001D0871D2|nr:2Fe-2S iron-sulfur cluster-binding protein [Rhodobacter sp. Har01]MCB6179924.1 NADH-quinone oxidoreductase subunit NuoG [Rhodobacter sp. Har01]
MSVKLTLNGREITVEDGRDLLSVALEAGVDVPHFCWHGALGSVGACRKCAVKVGDKVEMACMTPASEGMVVETEDPEAARFRAQVTEWLMLNHPHDCAVCEEGGACHLQDMVVATGHHKRRATGPKRTHRNQDLGPLLTHEMNRCIGCWRCLRFYRDHAGGRDFDAFGAHDRLWFGRHEDGPLDSPFAGNLAEVCPTGVFADKAWSKVYARPWDMTATPAICTHCSVGCNLTLNERSGTLRRVQNRYHGAINGFFLCDRGRWGPWSADAPTRLTGPSTLPDLTGAIGLGSPRASLESNWALRRRVGADHFFAGITDSEAALTARMASLLKAHPTASIADIAAADAILVLGEDLTATAPRAALALRQAARGAERDLACQKGVALWLDQAVRVAGEGRRSPIALVTPLPHALDDVATWPLRRPPHAIAAFARLIAAALRGAATDPEAAAIAQALAAAKAPLIVSGASLGLAGPVEAAAEIATALGPKARLALFPPEAGSFGLSLLGPVGGLEAAVARLDRSPGAVIVLENDLFHRADPALVEQVFEKATSVIVLDHLATETTAAATLAIPVAAPAEAAGTWINHEGRAQRSFGFRPPRPEAPAAWRLLAGEETDLDALLTCLTGDLPALAPIALAAGPATPRAHPRQSGRTAQDRAGRVPEGQPRTDPDSPLNWSMEGARAADPALATWTDRPGLHSVSAAYAAQQWIGGPLKGGDPGVSLREAAPDAGPMTDPAPGDGLIGLPLHSPFAAHEADTASPPLAARTPGPRVALHPDDAARLGLAEGARLLIDGRPAPAPLTLDAAISPGHIGLTGLRAVRAVKVKAAP